MYDVTLRCVRATIVAVENPQVTHSECMFIALGITHTMRMHRVILLSVSCPDLQYFSTLSHKRHEFRKKKNIEHKMCVLISTTTFV